MLTHERVVPAQFFGGDPDDLPSLRVGELHPGSRLRLGRVGQEGQRFLKDACGDRRTLQSFPAGSVIQTVLADDGNLVGAVREQLLDVVGGPDAASHGERDEEHQFGVTIPFRGWTLDADNFLTRASNFFDHNNLNNSDIFFPITIQGARINGWELTLHSPRIHDRGQIYLTYSNQLALGFGNINGGLTDFSFGEGFALLDHDQRNTLHIGGNYALPWRSYASTDVYYASGFTNGNSPPDLNNHLQPHTTFDLTLGKEFGEKFSVSVNGINVANRRVLLDNSFTFGGTHFLNPREIFVQIRYHFHY